MKMNRAQGLLTAVALGIGMLALAHAAIAGPGKGKGKGKGHHNHHAGHQMLGARIKTNGVHQIDKKGDYAVHAEVKNGKVAGVHVKHASKGDIPVKKYKTNKKMAEADQLQPPAVPASQYVGTTYIGYAYVDEFGNEEIYWFPYDMILDPETGAIDYVPAEE